MSDVDDLVRELQLLPHPEGGHYRETYRDTRVVYVDGKRRSASTAILFLLCAGDISALHRIAADEVWHFYRGDDVEIVSFDEQGALRRERLGADPSTGAVPQLVVPARRWFGSRVWPGVGRAGWALVGCTVAPGFDFADFELGTRGALVQSYPDAVDVVTAFTRG